MKTSIDEEISLIDLYDFLVDGWKIILSITFIGVCVGFVTSYNKPQQFEARGLIQSASTGSVNSVNSVNSINSVEVEPSATLAEKMQSPAYYDIKAVAACPGEGGARNLEATAKALNAKVASNSNFVSVVYLAESRDKALRCLDQVLAVVVENQKDLVEANLTPIKSSLEYEKKVVDQLRNVVNELELERSKQLKSKDKEHSMPTSSIVAEHEIMTHLLAVERKIDEMEKMLKPPYTKEAIFVMPIFVSEQVVSARHRIVITRAITGLFCGVLIVLLWRVFASVKKQLEERRKSASITP